MGSKFLTVHFKIYILSLPSFRWINVTSENNNDNNLNGGNPVARQNHICTMYRDRQLISLGGGLVFGDQVVNQKSCNNSWPTLRVFDTSTLAWKGTFNPNMADYYVPEAVTNVIGGT